MTDARIRLVLPVLFLAAWIVYRPALNRVFTADQVWYFAELNGNTSLAEGLKLVDYAAVRRYWKGDESLFRPLLFVWLAVENSLFSYHHVRWNAANLVLHGLVAVFLLRLLLMLHRSWWAVGMALYFTVLKPPLELVTWNHLGGYLFACLFLAAGLRAFVEAAHGNGPAASKSRVVFALAFTVAGLFYETMVPVSLLAAAVIVVLDRRHGRRQTAGNLVLLLMPVFVFGALYAVHIQHVARFFYVDNPDAGSVSRAPAIVANAVGALQAAWRWTLEMLFPSAVTIVPAPFDRFHESFAFTWTFGNVRDLAVAISGFAAAAAGISRAHLKRRLPILLVLAGSVILYGFVICMGRPLTLVLASAYYPYVACLLLITAGYAAIDFNRVRGWSRAVGTAALACAVLSHAAGTLAVTTQIGRLSREPSRLLTRMSRFVDAHKREPGFTFATRVHLASLDPPIALRQGYPDDTSAPKEVRYLTEIVFQKYYDARAPKYVFEQSPQ